MTIIEELNWREAEEIELVREKYRKLREHQQGLCKKHERIEVDANHIWFGQVTYVVDKCKHCGADLSTQSK